MKWWVYIHDTVSERPYSLDELRELVDFHPGTRVCYEGSTEWKRAGEVPALEPLFGASSGSKHGITSWEQETIDGYGEAFLSSLYGLLFEPTSFYAGLNPDTSVLRSIVFSIFGGMVGYTGMQLFGWLMLPLLNPSLSRSLSYTLGLALAMVAGSILVPLAGVLNGCFYHLVLKLFSLGRQPLSATLKVFFYAFSPVMLLAVPGVGGVIAPIWILVGGAVGLKVVHELSVTQTITVLLTPCFVVLLAAFGLLFAVS